MKLSAIAHQLNAHAGVPLWLLQLFLVQVVFIDHSSQLPLSNFTISRMSPIAHDYEEIVRLLKSFPTSNKRSVVCGVVGL
jgi:hypothetical protein